MNDSFASLIRKARTISKQTISIKYLIFFSFFLILKRGDLNYCPYKHFFSVSIIIKFSRQTEHEKT